jgi:hypothetical protein
MLIPLQRDCAFPPPHALHSDKTARAGWPRVVAFPGLPQIRTCATNASGSSGYGFAT